MDAPTKALRPITTSSLSWWVRAVSMVALAVATAAGNTAVLTALRRLRRAPAHYPLASLAAADLLLGIIVLPVAIARELFVFHLNWLICSIWSTLDVLSCTASILSICLLGWERWGGITAPFARSRRAKRARLYAALVWPVATAVALPTAFVPSHMHHFEGEVSKACTVNTNVSYVFVSTFLSFYLPAGVMLATYVRILQALAAPREMPMRAHRGGRPTVKVTCIPENEIKNKEPSSPLRDKIQKVTAFLSPNGKHLDLPGAASNRTQKTREKLKSPDCFHSRQRRATRTIVLLMALFLVCWTPFFIMLPLDSLCECVSEVTQQLCTWLGFVNSALNPLVYAAASPSIRKALRDSFTSSSRTTDLAMTRPCVSRGR